MYKRSRGVQPVTNLSSGQSGTWTQVRQTNRPHCLLGWESSRIPGSDLSFFLIRLRPISSLLIYSFDIRFWYEVRFNINSLGCLQPVGCLVIVVKGFWAYPLRKLCYVQTHIKINKKTTNQFSVELQLQRDNADIFITKKKIMYLQSFAQEFDISIACQPKLGFLYLNRVP